MFFGSLEGLGRMELEHIGVNRLYELALDLEIFAESDFQHLEWCRECLEVFRALSQYNRFKTEVETADLQFADGFCTESITRTSTGPLADSSRKPSCS